MIRHFHHDAHNLPLHPIQMISLCWVLLWDEELAYECLSVAVCSAGASQSIRGQQSPEHWPPLPSVRTIQINVSNCQWPRLIYVFYVSPLQSYLQPPSSSSTGNPTEHHVQVFFLGNFQSNRGVQFVIRFEALRHQNIESAVLWKFICVAPPSWWNHEFSFVLKWGPKLCWCCIMNKEKKKLDTTLSKMIQTNISQTQIIHPPLP